MSVTTPSGTNGSIAVPTYGAANRSGGHQYGRAPMARVGNSAMGAQLQRGTTGSAGTAGPAGHHGPRDQRQDKDAQDENQGARPGPGLLGRERGP